MYQLIPPIRYTPRCYSGLPDDRAVRVWYLADYEQTLAVKAWYQRLTREFALTTARAQLEERLASLGESPEDKDTRSDIEEALRADFNELPERSFDDREYEEYASGLGPIIHRFEIAGREIPWPTTATDRICLLKSLPPQAVGQIVRGIATGAFDEELVPKS